MLFPIFSDTGEAVAIGGRVLPGSTDPAKYKNSPETPIYAKSKTLYGLNWAKADIAASDQVVVCEGYTDVIGFHQVGVERAVATCGTAFTEDHVRLLKRYASRVVLAFDADAAGQGAAERFYEWEQQYQVQVAVARLPGGADPGELAQQDPEALAAAVADATPFLGVPPRPGDGRPAGADAGGPRPARRAGDGGRQRAPRRQRPQAVRRAGRLGGRAAGRTTSCASPSSGAGARRVDRRRPLRRSAVRENAEFVAIAVLAQDWESIAEWLVEELFADEAHRRAFLALGAADGNLDAAIEHADPEAREVLERAAVADLDVDAGRRGPQPDRRRRPARAAPVAARPATPSRARRRRGPRCGWRSWAARSRPPRLRSGC